MVTTTYHNQVPRADALIGIVVAEGVSMLPVPAVVEERLARLLTQRKGALSEGVHRGSISCAARAPQLARLFDQARNVFHTHTCVERVEVCN